MFKVGFIDYYIDNWHSASYPAMLKEASGGEVVVTHGYSMTEEYPDKLSASAWFSKMGIIQCKTIQEVVDACDGLIVLSPNNSEHHESLAQLPLQSGKPTYIDKTFAPDVATARRIFALAEKHRTPCFSSSALRFATEYEGIDDREIVAINSWGPSNFPIYSIHQIEPIMKLIPSKGKRLMAVKGEKWYTVTVEFEDGRYATFSGFENGSLFTMQISCKKESKLIKVESAFFQLLMKEIAHFFLRHNIVVPHEDTLRVIAVRSAAETAMERIGEWVDIEN